MKSLGLASAAEKSDRVNRHALAEQGNKSRDKSLKKH